MNIFRVVAKQGQYLLGEYQLWVNAETYESGGGLTGFFDSRDNLVIALPTEAIAAIYPDDLPGDYRAVAGLVYKEQR